MSSLFKNIILLICFTVMVRYAFAQEPDQYINSVSIETYRNEKYACDQAHRKAMSQYEKYNEKLKPLGAMLVDLEFLPKTNDCECFTVIEKDLIIIKRIDVLKYSCMIWWRAKVVEQI